MAPARFLLVIVSTRWRIAPTAWLEAKRADSAVRGKKRLLCQQ
jgi:hypothetical protein